MELVRNDVKLGKRLFVHHVCIFLDYTLPTKLEIAICSMLQWHYWH